MIRSSRPTLLRGIGLRMAENGGSYIYQTLTITYVSNLGVQNSIGPLAVAIGAVSDSSQSRWRVPCPISTAG